MGQGANMSQGANMGKIGTRLLVAAVLPLALSGCKSFLGIRFASANPRPVAAAPAPESRATFTQRGRELLARGNTASAIGLFQQALAAGEPAAPAWNGMGVGFARIGRVDLAMRYFERAAAADAANPSYQQNLARLTRSPAFAMRRDGDLLAQAVNAPPKAAEPQSLATKTPGRLERLSRGEVRITTVAPQSAPTNRTALHAGFRPVVRIEFAKPTEKPGFQPIVRLELPAAKPISADSEARAEGSGKP